MPFKLYRRDGGDIWHYRGTVAGRRLRGSTGSAKKEVAHRYVSEIESRQWKGHFDGPEAVTDVRSSFDDVPRFRESNAVSRQG